MMQQNSQHEKLLQVLKQAGLPQFQLDTDGFPVPGPVVRYYREQMRYTDKDGQIRRWTQADLATRLQISELMVRLMETKNKGLDSIERRKTLATILKKIGRASCRERV